MNKILEVDDIVFYSNGELKISSMEYYKPNKCFYLGFYEYGDKCPHNNIDGYFLDIKCLNRIRPENMPKGLGEYKKPPFNCRVKGDIYGTV